MSDKLKGLIDAARRVEMTPQQREAQRISFAYGNAKFENDAITREIVVRASEGLRDRHDGEKIDRSHKTCAK